MLPPLYKVQGLTDEMMNGQDRWMNENYNFVLSGTEALETEPGSSLNSSETGTAQSQNLRIEWTAGTGQGTVK